MPNLPIPDLPGGTVESTDNILGVKSNEPGQDLVLFPYGSNLAAKVDVSTYDADQAVQDADIAKNATDIATNAAAIAATEIVADGAVQKSGDTMTGPLTVLDATAGGQALAYDQESFRLSGNAAEISWYQSSQPVDSKTFRIRTSNGVAYFQAATDAGVPVTGPGTGSLEIAHSDGAVDMSNAPSVSVPAPTGARQAAQTTAIDVTTGRMAINGIEIGTSGARNIPHTELINGWSSSGGSFATIQRVGNMVTVAVQGLGGQDNTSAAFWNVPSGFRPADAAFARTAVADGMGGVYRLYMGGNALALTTLSANVGGNPTTDIASLFFSISYATADAWPTSLPGTAV